MVNNFKFNLIEIYCNNEFAHKEIKVIYITLLGEFYSFKKEKPIKTLIEFLDKLIREKNVQENKYFYSATLSYLFLILLENEKKIKSLFKIECLLDRGEVYYVKLIHKKTGVELILKCFSKYITSNHIYEELNTFRPSFYINDLKLEVLDQRSYDNMKLLDNFLERVDIEVKNLFKNWNIYSFSISSLAKNIFNFNFNTHKILFKCSIKRDREMRKAYFGGRCEVVGNSITNDEQIIHYDFKNMYGLIMLECFPTGNLIRHSKIEKITKSGFYYVLVESLEMDIPVLPHFTTEDSTFEKKKTIYANGCFEGLYWYEELLLFIEKGGKILSIEYAYLFNGSNEKIFEEFAKFCINSRLKSKFNKNFWKAIIVSLYGRLGMGPKDTTTKLVHKTGYDVIKQEEIEKELWIGDNVLIEIKAKTEDHKRLLNSNVTYAAIITSKGRTKLYRTIDKIISKQGRILYYDTDGIYASFEKTNPNKF